jgi:hypothetical protein
MPEAAREELKPLADKVFELRYRGREVPLRGANGRRGRRTFGIAYIPDRRPRFEREPIEDDDADLDEDEAEASVA